VISEQDERQCSRGKINVRLKGRAPAGEPERPLALAPLQAKRLNTAGGQAAINDYKRDRVPKNEYKRLLTTADPCVFESGVWIGDTMKSTKSDLLDRLEGWNEESIRLLTAMLERIAELPDAEATALTERVLAEIDGRMH
jgi:hypothetical protein